MARKPVAAFEEIIIRLQIGMIDPVANRVSRLFGDFKLNRLPVFFCITIALLEMLVP
jgi:hypothetical protein